MKKMLIAGALFPLTLLTACAVYPDHHGGYDRYERGDSQRYQHRGGDGRYGHHRYSGDQRYRHHDDHRRGQGYYCPPGQEKKGRC